MEATAPAPLVCRLAACRENGDDGKEWSLFVVNTTAMAIEACLERVSYEWGDRGHSERPDLRARLPALGHALIWREGWEGAEMNMELSIALQSPGQKAWLLFELGKLYRRRDPAWIEGLGRTGWLVLPSRSVPG